MRAVSHDLQSTFTETTPHRRQVMRRQVFKHGIRVGSVSPGPVITALLDDWSEQKLSDAKEAGSLIDAVEIAGVVMFMLTRPRNVTIRDVVILPTNFDL